MPQSYQTVRLAAGKHRNPDEGVCVMELASMLAGEPFSDRPRSVSRTLAAVLRGYNDGLDDARRQQLKPYASAAVGTAGGWRAERRRRRLVRRTVLALRPSDGAPAALTWALDATDIGHVAGHLAIRVRRYGDEALHRSMLGLFDALVANSPCALEIASLDRDDARACARL